MRGFLWTVAAILALALAGTVYTLGVACAVIAAGSLATCATRSWAIAQWLQGKGA